MSRAPESYAPALPPISLPGAAARIAMVSVHTSPTARPGGEAAGGMNVYIREISRHLARLGYEVDIFTRADGTLPELQPLDDGVRLIAVPAGPLAPIAKDEVQAYLPEFLHGMRRFRQQHDLHYDLIHSHYWHAGWIAMLLAPRWGVPHVSMFHTLGDVKNRARSSEHEPERRIAAERRIACSADRVICATEHERNLLMRLYGAEPERTAVIPCGVDVQRFRPLDRRCCRARLGLGPEPLVLYAGRVEPLKGIDILVDAMALLQQPDARLLVVGGDSEAAAEIERLRAQAASLGIVSRVTFVGAVDQSLLPLYYSAADICVVPSYYESFGLVAVEAMACGVPVVASHVGGLATTVRDAETGYLIPWRCPAPFAERIELLLENDELRGNIGRAAHEAMQRFSWPKVTAALAAEYTRLWQEAASGHACHGASGAALRAQHHACEAR